MELTYDNILKFMKDYFKAYNKYGQNPETIHRMHEYYAPNLEYIPYVAGAKHTTNRDQFLSHTARHPSSYETLIPEEFVIDEKRKVTVVLLTSEVTDKKVGKVVVAKKYLVYYNLMTDENNTIKINKIVLFWEILPPGTLDVLDVFG